MNPLGSFRPRRGALINTPRNAPGGAEYRNAEYSNAPPRGPPPLPLDASPRRSTTRPGRRPGFTADEQRRAAQYATDYATRRDAEQRRVEQRRVEQPAARGRTPSPRRQSVPQHARPQYTPQYTPRGHVTDSVDDIFKEGERIRLRETSGGGCVTFN